MIPLKEMILFDFLDKDATLSVNTFQHLSVIYRINILPALNVFCFIYCLARFSLNSKSGFAYKLNYYNEFIFCLPPSRVSCLPGNQLCILLVRAVSFNISRHGYHAMPVEVSLLLLLN